jgi:hypothetical protein
LYFTDVTFHVFSGFCPFHWKRFSVREGNKVLLISHNLRFSLFIQEGYNKNTRITAEVLPTRNMFIATHFNFLKRASLEFEFCKIGATLSTLIFIPSAHDLVFGAYVIIKKKRHFKIAAHVRVKVIASHGVT